MRNQREDNSHLISRNKRLIFANQNTIEKKFWFEKLTGKPIRNTFPFHTREVDVSDPLMSVQEFSLSSSVYSLLCVQAGNSDYKIHVILMAGVQLLLHQYTGNSHVTVVTPIYKPKAQGKFINTVLPICLSINSTMTFRRLLKETAAAIKEASAHRNYPVDLIPEKMELNPVDGYSLFDVALILENIHYKHHLYPIIPRIDFCFLRGTNGIDARVEYDSNLYEISFIHDMLENFIRLLGRVLKELDEPVYEMEVVPKGNHTYQEDSAAFALNQESEIVYQPPRDYIEKKLVDIWGEVLEIDTQTIGIDDIFFAREGQSLKAIMMTSLIHKTFDISIPLPMIFKLATVRGLAEYIKTTMLDKQGEIIRYVSINPVEEKEYYPLSSAQERLYILKQLDPESTVYNVPQVILLGKQPDKEQLEWVFQQLINRHESLRTSFEVIAGQPYQVTHENVLFSMEFYQVSSLQESETIIQNFIRPFDLSYAPLLRVGLINMDQKKWILMADMHHIISDATSRQILALEFASLYDNKKMNTLRLSYKDYSEWLKLTEQQHILKKQEIYWLQEYQGDIPVLDLPVDFERPVLQNFEGSAVKFSLGKQNFNALQTLSCDSNSTLFMVLLALFNVLLSRLSGQEDIVVGIPVVGRRHADLQGIMGFFVNTLAIRNFPSQEKTFIQFLSEVKKQTLEAFDNQDYPFETLVEHLHVKRNSGRNPLFSTMLSMHHPRETDMGTRISNLNLKLYDYESRIAKFDLTIIAVEEKKDLVITFQYCTKLFKEETIKRFIDYFKKMIPVVIDNNEKKLKDITISSELLEVDTRIEKEEFLNFGF
jgi:acyl carrier protein